MVNFRRIAIALAFIVSATIICTGQVKRTAAAGFIVTVGGEVAHPVSLTVADFAKLPRQTVHVKDADGKDVAYEGVALAEVLKLAGVEFGTMLKGNSLGLYLVAEAFDKFHVIFALPELDPAFTDRVIILADKQNGIPLDPSQGPLRLIVPDEKRPARWVRHVTTLTVRRGE